MSLDAASMATEKISSGLGKLQDQLNGAAGGQKVADVKNDPLYKDYHDPSNRITTDYGVKQHSTGMYQQSYFPPRKLNLPQTTGSKSPPRTRQVPACWRTTPHERRSTASTTNEFQVSRDSK